MGHVHTLVLTREWIAMLHVSKPSGGDDHQRVSLDRHSVIPMPINTLFSDHSLQTMY